MEDNSSAKRLVDNRARIKVLGFGGGGSNSVSNMIRSGLTGVEFFAANTDAQALSSCLAPNKIHIGEEVTRGLGAGADPDVGQAAARESIEALRKAMEGADMVFLTAGLGGGTGGGSIPVAAEVAKELGALTVAVVTKPFLFEGKRRMKNADRGIEELRKQVDTLITIPNQRLLSIAGRNTSLIDAFRRADDILYQAVKGISDLIVCEGLVNVDFADVRSVMSEMGMAMMGTGEARGENRAVEAAEKAISSPLLEDISIHGARGVLINITASTDVTLQEVNEAAEIIHSEAHPDANIIWGMVIDPTLEDTVRVTVVATGFGAKDSDVAGETTVLEPASVQPSPVMAADKPASAVSSSILNSTRASAEAAKVDPAGLKKPAAPASDVIKLRKISVLANPEDDESFSVPAFLRRQ